MSKYIRAVVAAKAIAEKYGIPLGDLVDTFSDIPAADVALVRHERWIEHKHFNHDHYIDSTYECSECNVE